ncbi:hypothetical protein OAJ80_02365 [Candidatus Thioglobus sp.]|nr:hypothetical protein [Candidatus Thioglobus sp.]
MFLTLFLLTGCSNIQLEAVSTSAEETQRILAMGLTHEENLIEASKIKSSHMASVVKLQLMNAHDEKIQAEIDLIESNKYADLVIHSNNNFTGPEIVKTIKRGVLETDIDTQTLFFKGSKNDKGKLEHSLIVKIEHVSSNKRAYLSANFCDSWGRCDGDIVDFELISSNSSNCTTTECNHSDVVEFEFSDEFLRSKISESGFTDGITMRMNRKRFSNKINVPSTYLTGYLRVAN